MSVAVWISLLTIFVAAGVALANAYMNRKQLRQIELHRADPSIPLVPPPHPVTQVVWRYGYYVAAAAYDTFMLVRDMHATGPLTRGDVAKISLDMISLAAIIALAFASLLTRLADSVLATAKYAVYAADSATGAVTAIDQTTKILEVMDTRIKKLEDRRKPG
jgi:hypothetical protein